MIDAEQEKRIDIFTEIDATPSRRPWHKPSVMRIDIKKTLAGIGSPP
jgi:hypothetical protein